MSKVTKDNNPKLYYELFPEEALKELDRQRDFYLKQLEAYENMRKEAIKKITIKQARIINEKGYKITDLDLDELLNILNKVGSDK